MARYVLCPRCELNYIDADKQEYCDVCIKEMQGAKTFSDDLEEEEATEETELCPICGENYMRPGEKMCDECKQHAAEYDQEEEVDPEKDEAWRDYLDEEADDLTMESDAIDIGDDFIDDFDDEEFADGYVEEEDSSDDDEADDFADDFTDLDDDDDDDDEDEDEEDDF